jgi:hypothetical protein
MGLVSACDVHRSGARVGNQRARHKDLSADADARCFRSHGEAAAFVRIKSDKRVIPLFAYTHACSLTERQSA